MKKYIFLAWLFMSVYRKNNRHNSNKNPKKVQTELQAQGAHGDYIFYVDDLPVESSVKDELCTGEDSSRKAYGKHRIHFLVQDEGQAFSSADKDSLILAAGPEVEH